ncbi:MAG: O-antigen ligase family protein [Oscillospiraceae bacterium]|nr:O-antigen ligase family protein [Oscillospiraceae bacterium]
MRDAAFEQSVLCRFAGRVWSRFLAKAGESVILRLLLGSRMLTFLTRHMPVVSGISVGLLFIVPHGLFNNLYSFLVMLALTVLLLLGALNGNVKGFAMHRMGWYAAAFWLMVLIGALTSISVGLSLRFLIFHCTAFLTLVITRSVLTDRRALTRFVAVLLSAITAGGLYGLLQSVAGVNIVLSQVDLRRFIGMPGRIYAFFDNPNNFAGILVLTLPFFAALFFSAQTRLGRRAAFLGALPPAVALVLTFSRSGWMAFGLSVVVFFYFTYRWAVPLIFAAALLAAPLLPSTITDRFFSIFAGDSSISYRTFVSDTYRPIVSSNWALGSGLGSEVVYESLLEYYERFPWLNIVWWRVAPHAHNLYLQLWAELGIVGVASFCGMMITFLKKSVKTLFNSARKNFIAAAGMAGVAGSLLIGFAEYIWFYPRAHLLFWLVVGVTLSAFRLQEEPESVCEEDAPPVYTTEA